MLSISVLNKGIGLTFVSEGSEQVHRYHFKSSLKDFLVYHRIRGLLLIKQINNLDESLFLIIFEILVFLLVRKVCYLVARLELSKIKYLPF